MAFLKKSNDGPREDPIIVKPKVYPKKTLRSFRTPNDFCIAKNLFILFSVLLYDTVGDGDKYSFETFGFGRPHFQATSHFKIEAKEFSMLFMNAIK